MTATYAKGMLSSNLGLTIRSVRQAVLDGRQLVGILRQQGFQEIVVMGVSLGSWVAGLVAAHDYSIRKAILMLAGGSLADMVWTGRATRHIRSTLEKELQLGELNQAWSPLNLENYASGLARSDLQLHFILARHDTVVLPDVSTKFLAALEANNAFPQITRFNCGHYSLSILPFSICAGAHTLRFLMGD